MKNLNNTNSIISSLGLTPRTLTDIKNHPLPKREWLIDGLIPDDYPVACLISASVKTGKTWYAERMMCSVASGTPFFGKATKKGKVLYLNFDNTARTVEERAMIISQNMGLDEEAMNNIIVISPSQSYAMISDVVDAVSQMYSTSDLRMVIVDALANVFSSKEETWNENDSTHATRFMAEIKRGSRGTKCPWVLIHHDNKTMFDRHSDGPDVGSVRGSSALTANADTIIQMHRYNINNGTFENIRELFPDVSPDHVTGVSIGLTGRDGNAKYIDYYMIDGEFREMAPVRSKGKPGPRNGMSMMSGSQEEEAFNRVFNELQNEHGKVKVSWMADALGVSINTLKAKADAFGYIRPKKGYLQKAEA